jgi:hypothetical protein
MEDGVDSLFSGKGEIKQLRASTLESVVYEQRELVKTEYSFTVVLVDARHPASPGRLWKKRRSDFYVRNRSAFELTAAPTHRHKQG